MDMGGHMATATELLTLTQWFSPSFPVGTFAYSHGLEWAVQSGDVTSAAQVQDWIETVLRHGAGWNDCVLMAAAYRVEEAQKLAHIDATARALAATRERLQETVLQGQAFCQAFSKLTSHKLDDLTYPVATGHAASLEGLPLDLTMQMYLHSFLSNLSAAAMRLVPLGQSDGQAIIRDLAPVCAEIAEHALNASLDDLSSTSFLADIAAMKHETQYSRIFRT